MHHLDAVREALWALNQIAEHRGDDPIALPVDLPEGEVDEVIVEKVGDLIANLLHLLVAAGEDPVEAAERAVRTYVYDAEDADLTMPVPYVEAYHGSPWALAPGDELVPGDAVHHVFACERIEQAASWGKKKARGGEHHVYRVRMGEDAFTSSGHILATSATVIEEVLA